MDEKSPTSQGEERNGLWQTYGGGIKELAMIAVEASLRSIGRGLTEQIDKTKSAREISYEGAVAVEGDRLAGGLADHPNSQP